MANIYVSNKGIWNMNGNSAEIGRVGEFGTNLILIDVDRYTTDDDDLSTGLAFIAPRTGGGDYLNRIYLSQEVVSDDRITFGWLVGKEATVTPGDLYCSLMVKISSEGIVTDAFNSNLQTFVVADSNTDPGDDTATEEVEEATAASIEKINKAIDTLETKAAHAADMASVNQSITELSELNVFKTPEMYGAAGDGETDDTDCMQQCFDECGAAGIEIRLSGQYKLTSAIILKAKSSAMYTVRGNCQSDNSNSNVKVALPELIFTGSDGFVQESTERICIDFDHVYAVCTADDTTGYSFLKADLYGSRLTSCAIYKFGVILTGSATYRTVFRDCTFKMIYKNFMVLNALSASCGFYDSLVTGCMISHVSTTINYDSVIVAKVNKAFGEDSQFVNNWVEYFAYFMQLGSLEKFTMTASTGCQCGLCSGNTFQYMLTMCAPSTVMTGCFTGNCFSGFSTGIFDLYSGSKMAVFGSAGYDAESDVSATTITEISKPSRWIRNATIKDNLFVSSRALYLNKTDDYSGLTNPFAISPFIFDGNRKQTGSIWDDCTLNYGELTAEHVEYKSIRHYGDNE